MAGEALGRGTFELEATVGSLSSFALPDHLQKKCGSGVLLALHLDTACRLVSGNNTAANDLLVVSHSSRVCGIEKLARSEGLSIYVSGRVWMEPGGEAPFFLAHLDFWAPLPEDIEVLSAEVQKECNASQYNLHDVVVVRRGSKVRATFGSPQAPLCQGIRLELLLRDKYGPEIPLQECTIDQKSSEVLVGAPELLGGRCACEVSGVVPVDCRVGTFELQCTLKDGTCLGGGPREVVDKKQQIFVIFNAWCNADPAFCSNDEERKENLIDEMGRVLLDSKKKRLALVWDYSQFGTAVGEGVMHLLKQVPHAIRKDPDTVAAYLCSTIHASEDGRNGILLGKWQGPYPNGRHPLEWRSSSEIFGEFIRNGFHPVKYAQCWVFSAVLTSVLRCVGLVTRQVMCKPCAHNRDLGLITRTWYNEKGETFNCADMIWNFHNWNEVWFSQAGCTGPICEPQYQAIDATYGIGPVPLYAIRNSLPGFQNVNFFMMEVLSVRELFWVTNSDNDREKCRMYEVEPDKHKPFVYTPKFEGPTARDITSGYRLPGVPPDPKSVPLDFRVSVSDFTLDLESEPSLFAFTLNTSASLHVVAAVLTSMPGTVCAETLLSSTDFDVVLSPANQWTHSTSVNFSVNKTGENPHQEHELWLRLFIKNTETGDVAFWQRHDLYQPALVTAHERRPLTNP